MRADLSRDTFQPDLAYQGVVLQMGRVLLDADFNEQGAVLRHLARQVARDVVGAPPTAGAPRGESGFALAPSPDGTRLLLSPGRLYADGLVVDHQPQVTGAAVVSASSLQPDDLDLDGRPVAVGDLVEVTPAAGGPPVVVSVTDVTGGVLGLGAPHGSPVGSRVDLRRAVDLTTQPFGFFRPSPAVDSAPLVAGRHVAVLRVRLVDETVVDRPTLAEVALGARDSSTRIRLVWQVLLTRVGAVGSGTVADWERPVRTARLQPALAAPDPLSGDCALPPDAAFRGSEHRLYRVEVNDVAPDGTIASLLWDTDNGSVASRITTLGQTMLLDTFGPRGSDGLGGFADNQVVTVSDQHAEWDGRPGQVLTTLDADPDTRTIDVSAVPDADPQAAPRLRRWSGQATGVTPGEVVDLGDGLTVRVTGSARTGDYWLLPARSAFGGDGTLDWPRTSDGTFRALPAHGPDETWLPLALVDFDGTTFAAPTDLRTTFPPLTAITAADVDYDDAATGLGAATVQQALVALSARSGESGTITLVPGPDWEQALGVIPAGGDARIYFPPGDYPTARRVVLSGKGSLVLTGVGPASLVRATDDEVALVVESCASLVVRDLAVRVERAERPRSTPGASGGLSVLGTPQVEVSGLVSASVDGVRPRTACLTVTGPAASAALPAAFGRHLPSRVVVRDCLLSPGEYQTGLQVLDFDRVAIRDVVVQGPDATTLTSVSAFPRSLLGALRTSLLRGLVLSPPAPPAGPAPGPAIAPAGAAVAAVAGGAPGRVKVIESGGVSFQTAGRIAQPWRDALQKAPVPVADVVRARIHLLGLADQAFAGVTPAAVLPLRNAVDSVLLTREPVVAQGIVVGGRHAEEVRVTGCRLSGVVKGITVALSDRATARGQRARVGRVVVSDNQVDVRVPPEAVGGRHGLYLGHAASVLVADNILRLTSQALQDPIPSAGVRLGGFFGADVVVRDNHTVDFRWGLWIRPNADAQVPVGSCRWLVRGNLFERAEQTVRYEPIGFGAAVPPLTRVENLP